MFSSENLIGYTRGASIRAIAGCQNLTTLAIFAEQSRYPHVRKVAGNRIADVMSAPAPADEKPLVAPKFLNFVALAQEFGEPDAAVVRDLYHAKGDDLGALRRSLNGRRSARLRKAAKTLTEN
jgi:hypothetical protein